MRRSAAPEWMDDPGRLTETAAALPDIARLTRVTFGHRPVLAFLERLAAGGVRRLTVLEAGAGSGDLLAAMARWGEQRGVALELTGLDPSPAAGPPRWPACRWIRGDVLALDMPVDAIVAVHLAHHFDDADVLRLLRVLEARSRLGWMILDLQRHWLVRAGAWAAPRLLRLHPMIAHDAPRSVARAFTRADWTRLLAAAAVPAQLAWAFPGRWAVSRVRFPA